MSRKDLLHEGRFVDLDDSSLKEALGYLWESVKNLNEARKNDPEVNRMMEELKQYKRDNFDDQIKELTRKLKAARTIAKLRGLAWKAPEEIK